MLKKCLKMFINRKILYNGILLLIFCFNCRNANAKDIVKNSINIVGNNLSKQYHLSIYAHTDTLKDTLILNSQKEAIDKGYSPCKICFPLFKKTEKITYMDIEKLLGNIASFEIKTNNNIDYFNENIKKIQKIIDKLTKYTYRKDIKYNIYIIKEEKINAISTPNGNIFITTGLLNILETEDELAAVIAHEIAHVDLRHSLKQYLKNNSISSLITLGSLITSTEVVSLAGEYIQLTQFIKKLILSGYSREYETEADIYSYIYLKKAGYDYNAVKYILLKIKDMYLYEKQKPDFLSTHPYINDRVKNIINIINYNYLKIENIQKILEDKNYNKVELNILDFYIKQNIDETFNIKLIIQITNNGLNDLIIAWPGLFDKKDVCVIQNKGKNMVGKRELLLLDNNNSNLNIGENLLIQYNFDDIKELDDKLKIKLNFNFIYNIVNNNPLKKKAYNKLTLMLKTDVNIRKINKKIYGLSNNSNDAYKINSALSLINEFEFDKAITLLEQVDKLEYKYYLLGKCYFEKLDYLNAEINIQKYLKYNNKDNNAKILIGIIYEKSDKIEKAKEIWKSIILDKFSSEYYKNIAYQYLYN